MPLRTTLIRRIAEFYALMMSCSVAVLLVYIVFAVNGYGLFFIVIKTSLTIFFIFILLNNKMFVTVRKWFPSLKTFIVRCVITAYVLLMFAMSGSRAEDGAIYYAGAGAALLAIALILIAQLGAILGRSPSP